MSWESFGASRLFSLAHASRQLLSAADALRLVQRLNNRYVRKVAVVALVVEAVADDEFVADFEADVVGLVVGFEGRRFEEESRAQDLFRIAGFESFREERHCEAGVDDVFDEKYVFAFDALCEVEGELHFAR